MRIVESKQGFFFLEVIYLQLLITTHARAHTQKKTSSTTK